MRAPLSRIGPTALAAAALASACAPEPEVLPRYGEVVVVADTDVPVPAFASRLRVDVFDRDGVWLESRDVARLNPTDWPASFSLYATDEKHARKVLVRLRAYPDGKLRDYQGERFQPRPEGMAPGDEIADPAPTDGPRLVRDDEDLTPADEPAPLLAIDRLVQVELTPGEVHWATVVLAGACIGTMSDLVNRETCVDSENVRSPVSLAKLSDHATTGGPSRRVGTFAEDPACKAAPRPPSFAADGSPLYDEEVCVPGGVFVMGSEALIGANTFGPAYDPVPERPALMPATRIDRYEVTVGRYRAAHAAGFSPPLGAAANNAPITADGSGAELCSYSTKPAPGGQDREALPVTCVSWTVARAFCKFIGGDLLTEAQWEWAATAAGRAVESPFPWGTTPPSCDAELYDRYKSDDTCRDAGFGPAAVNAFPTDTTPALGIVGMGGNSSEWVLDRFRSLRTACWASAPLADPRCWDETPGGNRSTRGSGWQQSILLMPGAARFDQPAGDNAYPSVGFRCARPGAGP